MCRDCLHSLCDHMCRVLCRDAHISVHYPLYITNPFHVCVCRCVVCCVGAGVAALFTINFNARAERSVLEYNKLFVSHLRA